VLVLGPTGVGKTTLRMKVEHLLIQQMSPLLEADPGRLPFVSVEVVPSETGRFRWRDYFSRLLAAMHEPLIDSKIIRDPRGAHSPVSMTGGADLSYAVELALRHRRPPVVFVDEAQHLARISSGRRLSDQLDVIKSIANRTQTVHVLFGTYELLAFRNLSAQLSRRSMDLHFQRYGADPADRQVFQSILLTFQKQLPFTETENELTTMWEFLYERSVGCVGILKEWLMRACVRSIRYGASTISREHLEKTALSISQCEKILAESRDGETRLHDNEDSRLRFRTLLGIEPQSRGIVPPVASTVPVSRRPKPGRVGQRSPRRDPIQEEAAAAYA
jgi:energy-coupling factor transporter ATP-binding protein EcfA2